MYPRGSFPRSLQQAMVSGTTMPFPLSEFWAFTLNISKGCYTIGRASYLHWTVTSCHVL